MNFLKFKNKKLFFENNTILDIIINRLKKYFGNCIGVYHSKFNANERVEIWENVLKNEKYDIVLGARSALFLPFQKLFCHHAGYFLVYRIISIRIDCCTARKAFD